MTDTTHHLDFAQATAAALLARLEQAKAVVVASEDGFELASASSEPLDAARIAAITSSMSAIGAVVTTETDLGAVRCITVEADGGYLVMRATQRKGAGLIVAAMVGRDALLGLAMHAVSEAARALTL